MSVMSVSLSASQAASDEDASDDKQTALRRRTVTGGRRRRREVSETGGAEEDSDSETAGQAQPSERTRQKKFSKYFKDLPEEVCTVRELSDQSVASLLSSLVTRHLLCSGGRHPPPGTSLRHSQLYWLPLQRLRLRHQGTDVNTTSPASQALMTRSNF